MQSATGEPVRRAKRDILHGLNADRQRHILSAVTSILRDGRPTLFAFEGACRHGLRIRLILEGWRWQRADDAAAEIVARALRMIGATRPSWYAGQPAYTEEGFAPIRRTHCRRCGKPIDAVEMMSGWQSAFCSNACRVSHRRHVEGRTRADYDAALRATGELKRLKRITRCPNCGAEFVPKKAQWPPDPAKPRYCSNRCSKQHYFAKRRQEAKRQTFGYVAGG